LNTKDVQTHTILKTQDAITKLSYTVLPHPLYGPNLLRQIFTFMERSKKRQRKFGIDEEVTGEVTNWL